MIEMQMNAQSARLLERAMKAAERKTDWVIEKQANKAMWYICRSAGSAMKPKSMKGKRELVKNPERTGRGAKARGSKFLIKVLHQDKPTTYIKTNDRTDKRRKIAKLGLARTVMSIAAGRFGADRGGGPKTKGAKKFVRTVKQHTRNKHRVSVIAALTYLFDAFPGIVDTAIRKGMTSFVREFDRDWATALKAGEI